MRYIVRGCEIRSENAAKPASLAGGWLLKWIKDLCPQSDGLDLGCGKLRYTIPMSKRIKSVTAVDSRVQVDREQVISGERSTVRRYAAKHLENVRIHAIEDRQWQKIRFDVVLCSNVLSAIPARDVRNELVLSAHRGLKKGGAFLLTTQFHNSYFSAWSTDSRVTKYCDGFLVKGAKSNSFYALLDSDALVTICRKAGFSIVHSGHAKELAFVIATR